MNRIEEVREKAEDWEAWLIEQSEEYRRVEGELDARDTIIRVARQTLKSVQEPPEGRYYDFSNEQEYINEQAEQLLDQLDELEAQTSGVTNDLVFLLTDAKEIEETQRRSAEYETTADEYISLKIDQEREEKAFRQMDQESEDF